MATALNQTTLSAAISATATTIPVASATNISAPVANFKQSIYVIGPGQNRGELMTVTSVSGTQIGVSRLDEYKAAWPSGSLVLIAPTPVIGSQFAGPVLGGFQSFDPPGASASNNSSAASAVQVTPWVNVTSGMQWIWSTIVNCWVPGWQNPGPMAPSDNVAAASGVVVPSGPLFHMTGTGTVTGFTRPTGFTHGKFAVIPDHASTSWAWDASGNIAVLGQAIQFRVVEFTYDPAANSGAGVWYPSYV